MVLSTSVAAIVHGELQHALHENGAVPEAGTVHRPQVDVMGVGAHDDVTERLVKGESQIRVTIQRVEVVFVVIHSPIQPG